MGDREKDSTDEAERLWRLERARMRADDQVGYDIPDAKAGTKRDSTAPGGRVSTRDPIKMSGQDVPGFWECPEERHVLEEIVERQVYLAIRELLAQPLNVDFVFDFVYPQGAGEAEPGWGIRLRVDGRKYEDIVTRFDFGKMLRSDMEDYRDREGALDSGPDLEGFKVLAKRMRGTLEFLEQEIEEALI